MDIPYGSPQKPMNMDAMGSKLLDCASRVAKPTSQENVPQLLQTTFQLDTVRDASQLVCLLAQVKLDSFSVKIIE